MPGSIHISPASRSAGRERVFRPKYTPGRYEPQNRDGELMVMETVCSLVSLWLVASKNPKPNNFKREKTV